MTDTQKTVQAIDGITPDRIPFDELLARRQPVILRGLVSTWPLVEAGRQSPEKAMDFMAACYSGKTARVYQGSPDTQARFSYDKSGTRLNYRVDMMNLLDVFSAIKQGLGQAEHPYYYVPSLVYAEGFPGLQSENTLRFDPGVLELSQLTVKIWIGTESVTGAHFDLPSNIACCAVGRRRFTLFPPEQVHNLYPGPFNPTPGGQVTTMVDLKNPDFETYPRFREALEAGLVADLAPGDALYYPSMWWHEVEAKDPFNAMVNYWWVTSPRYMANPMDVVMHAILGLRDRPDYEKQAWRELFDYYIFGSPEKPRAHLPKACQGVLGELDDDRVRRLRALLQHSLNR